MVNIENNFLAPDEYEELTNLHIEYAKVHWIGAYAEPKNILQKLVHKTLPKHSVIGATAWYNIRPTNPQWHNDISSYCTKNGVFYRPKKQPIHTHLYYVKSPETGGELVLETGDIVTPEINRHIFFSCDINHRVKPYTGNRVSIGWIWWKDYPLYDNLNAKENTILERVWEIEDKASESLGRNNP